MTSLKALVRIHTVELNGVQSGFKQAFRPRPNVPTLAPLGAPVLAGFARRPIWADPRTPAAVAANIWRARAAARCATTSATVSPGGENRSRVFARTWELNMAGFPSADGWSPSAVKHLHAEIAKKSIGSIQPERPEHPVEPALPPGKRRRVDDVPALSSTRAGVSRLPHDPAGEPPLPSMSREFKRARLNDPLTQETLPTGGGSSSSASPPATLNRCMRGDSSNSSGSACQRGEAAAKRPRRGHILGAHSAPCGVCGMDTAYAECRYLPNSPVLTHRWRGAWPGSAVCRNCYSDFEKR